MKKRALAILMILVLATVGLFAAMPSSGNGADQLTATLNATIGDFLNHGFTIGTGPSATKYNATVTVNDAFNATTPPSFKYGYKTNAAGGFEFKMTVGDFIHEDGLSSGTVKIKSVAKGLPAVTMTPASGDYTIFNISSSGGLQSDETTITIVPARGTDALDHAGADVNNNQRADDAPAGSYTATIYFNVSAS